MANEIVVGYCHPEMVNAVWHDCMMFTLMRDLEGPHHIAGISSIQGGPAVSLLRHHIVTDFLANHEAPWLLMLDTDMTFTPDVLGRMLEAANAKIRPILGGLAFAYNDRVGGIRPTMMRRDDNGVYTPHTRVPADSLVKVDATGAACLLVHRSVYEAMNDGTAMPFYREYVVGNSHYGEDVGFCDRATQQFGFEIFVHTGIEFGHMKNHCITRRDYDAAAAHA